MERQAEQCLSCGHALGVGRFCINCGHPKGAPVDDAVGTTAERPAVPGNGTPRRPVPPPPVHQPPRAARYPLFADEAGSEESGGPGGAAATPPAPTGPTGAPPTSAGATTYGSDDLLPLEGEHRPRPVVSGLGWVVAALALVVLLVVGGIVLLNGSDEPSATAGDPEAPATTATEARPSPDTVPSPEATPPPEPTDTPDAGGGEPVELAARAQASPPDTAAASRDVEGNPVTYDAANMLDGRADTAWRMAGDASGQDVVVRLDAPATLTEVGLINGYAKIDPGYDGYRANRRITRVEWRFGDGTVLTQDLTATLGVQRIPVDGVVTDTVAVRIISVSSPARGRAGRDYTAISEISLAGSPA